jgi:hypothetical protein
MYQLETGLPNQIVAIGKKMIWQTKHPIVQDAFFI